MATFYRLLIVRYSTHRDASSPRLICLLHWSTTVNDCTSREIRPLDVFEQVINGCFWIIDQFNRCIDKLTKVMRRNIGGHTNSNTNLAVKEEIWHFCRQYHWFL